jgi:hypothetical protein
MRLLAHVMHPSAYSYSKTLSRAFDFYAMTLLVLPVEHTDVRKCTEVRIAGMGSLDVGNLKTYYGYEKEQRARIHNDINR